MRNGIIFLLFISNLFSMSCHQKSDADSGQSTHSNYVEQKMTLEEIEKQNPLKFLSSDGTYRKNFFGCFELKGKISNSATIATYKDVVLEVSFYTKTQTLLGTKQYSLYEFYPPGTTKSFFLKVDGFTGTENIGWSIIQVSIK